MRLLFYLRTHVYLRNIAFPSSVLDSTLIDVRYESTQQMKTQLQISMILHQQLVLSQVSFTTLDFSLVIRDYVMYMNINDVGKPALYV
jgi:chromosome condensin MukBEF complex kleisin-like MukF subunit